MAESQPDQQARGRHSKPRTRRRFKRRAPLLAAGGSGFAVLVALAGVARALGASVPIALVIGISGGLLLVVISPIVIGGIIVYRDYIKTQKGLLEEVRQMDTSAASRLALMEGLGSLWVAPLALLLGRPLPKHIFRISPEPVQAIAPPIAEGEAPLLNRAEQHAVLRAYTNSITSLEIEREAADLQIRHLIEQRKQLEKKLRNIDEKS